MFVAQLAAAALDTTVEKLDATKADDLKAVFFSGEPWLVQCGSKADLASSSVDAGLSVHEVVELALPKLPSEAKVGVLDCARKLPSGKTALERFKLDGSLSPTLVFAANGQPPLQITPSLMAKVKNFKSALFPNARQQAAALAHIVKVKSEPKVYELTKTEHLTSHCLKRRHCAVLLLPGATLTRGSDVVSAVLREFRSVAFVTINLARYEFSLASKLPEKADAKMPQLLALRSTPSKGDKKKVMLEAKAMRGAFDAAGVREFLAKMTAGDLDMAALKRAPQIRWRKQEAKESKSDRRSGSGGSSGGSSRPRSASEKRRQGGSSGGGSSRSGGTARRQGGGKSGGGGEDDAAQQRESEVEKRRRMAAEEEEAVAGMFADADEDDLGGDDDEAEAVDFDDDDEGEVEFDGGDDGGDDGGHDEL